MEEYLEAVEFWKSAEKTNTGFMCKFCSKEYEGFNHSTIKSHSRHLGRAECPANSYSDIIRTIFRKTYDRIPFDATDFQDMNAFGHRPNNMKYSLRSRTKQTTGDSVPTTTNQAPSKFAVTSRIEKKKKTGVSNISTHHLHPTSSNYTSPMQKKKIDIPMKKDFNNQNNQSSRPAIVLHEVAHMMDGVFFNMQNMLGAFKWKLDTHEDRGPIVLGEIVASFLEMQMNLDLYKSEVKSKLDTAILQCPPPPPPPPIAYKGPVGVLREVAPIIDGAFSEMRNMLAVCKLKLDTHEDRGPSLLCEIVASFVEMQMKLDAYKSVAKSKLDTAILQCLLPPPPIA